MVDNRLILWILDFLTLRALKELVNKRFFSLRCTGSSLGCVLSHLLFISDTNDCRGCLPTRQPGEVCRQCCVPSPVLRPLPKTTGPSSVRRWNGVEWCDSSCLGLNVTKTVEMFLDFTAYGVGRIATNHSWVTSGSRTPVQTLGCH